MDRDGDNPEGQDHRHRAGLGKRHMLAAAESALYAGGITMIEVTFNQAKPDSWPETQAAIRLIAREFEGRVIPGAGTVMTTEQVQMAFDAGARYIVSTTWTRR